MQRTARIFCCIFYALLLAPHVFIVWPTTRSEKLGGVEEVRAPIDLSFDRFWDGALISDIDAAFSRKLGFRQELIRTDNQLNFSVFRDISAQTSSPIVLGADNYLFEKSYIDAYNNRNRVPDSQLEQLAKDLAALQSLLHERGITLLLLISPNKALYHADKIPNRLVKPEAKNADRNVDALRRYLDQFNVAVLDTPELFEQLSPSPFPLFARGGTHWSYFGACLVTSRMMAQLERLSGKPLAQVDCSKVGSHDKPRLTDKDLAELANLWSISPFYERLGYPGAIRSHRPGEKKPQLVFVGSSFVWTVLHYVRKFHVATDYQMLYYYRSLHRQRGQKKPITSGSVDWPALLEKTDAVILEANEAAIEGVGYGFIQDAINFLSSSRRSSEEAPR